MSGVDLLAAIDRDRHEQVMVCRDAAAGYTAVIAVHSTALGPAVGGTRLWHYPDLDAALTDALRLSKGMTFKNALAGVPFGGGKSVLLVPETPPAGAAREALFRAHGRFIQRLGGRYITGEDVGTTPDDMDVVARETPHVAGLTRGLGDPSPFTARGVRRAIEATAREVWGTDDLAGRRIAIQGLGNVGRHLAAELAARGASLIVADLDPARAAEVAAAYGATVVGPDEILGADADLLAPCALGGVLNDETIPRLRVAAVAGGANNQLLTPADGDRIAARGILYAPDYVANAGGVLSGSVDIAGWERARMEKAVDAIYDTVRDVFAAAGRWRLTPAAAADRLAADRIAQAGRPPAPAGRA